MQRQQFTVQLLKTSYHRPKLARLGLFRDKMSGLMAQLGITAGMFFGELLPATVVVPGRPGLCLRQEMPEHRTDETRVQQAPRVLHLAAKLRSTMGKVAVGILRKQPVRKHLVQGLKHKQVNVRVSAVQSSDRHTLGLWQTQVAQWFTEGKFLKNELKRTELFKKTLGLIGAGNIATEVAKRAQGFGMTVLAFDPFIKEHPVATMVGSLEELVAKSDVLSLHTPLTDETKGMINTALIEKMKDGVMIINTGRGKCVVEEDLVDALKRGKVSAYGTDVWFSDPPPADCPLLTAPNVYMAPHLGASSKENLGRIGDEVVSILSTWK